MRRYVMCTLLLVLCMGCDFAASRRQAEQQRREATAARLKQLGEALHAEQVNDSSSDSVATDADDDAAESTDSSAGNAAAPEQPDPAVDNSPAGSD